MPTRRGTPLAAAGRTKREVTYAAYRLGKEYLTGEHAPKSGEKAVRWFRSSAEQGNPFAQYMLGVVPGWEALPRDQEQAVQWFRRVSRNRETPMPSSS